MTRDTEAQSPVLTVAMPVYNAEKHLEKAVESVLNQSFDNFELLIVDDGSTDSSVRLIEHYNDPRIRLIRKHHNQGITQALNLCLAQASGQYFARTDADDINAPDRFEKQVNYLREHPDVGLLGCRVEVINDQDEPQETWELSIEPTDVLWDLLYTCAIPGPTAIMPTHLAREAGGFGDDPGYAEDYDLWLKLTRLAKVANLKETLVQYRRHDKNISLQLEDLNQRRVRQLSRQAYQKLLGYPISPDIHQGFLDGAKQLDAPPVIVQCLDTTVDVLEAFEHQVSPTGKSRQRIVAIVAARLGTILRRLPLAKRLQLIFSRPSLCRIFFQSPQTIRSLVGVMLSEALVMALYSRGLLKG